MVLRAVLSVFLRVSHSRHRYNEVSTRQEFIGHTSQVDASLLISDLNANLPAIISLVDYISPFWQSSSSLLPLTAQTSLDISQ